jgi:hypothetical protein
MRPFSGHWSRAWVGSMVLDIQSGKIALVSLLLLHECNAWSTYLALTIRPKIRHHADDVVES